MSAVDYAGMSTKQLIQLFVETATATPNAFARLRQPNLADEVAPTLERQARVLTLKHAAAVLRVRKPIVQIRELFEDENPDVRGWAGGQFLPIDPGWAAAALQGLLKGLSTREVLDLQRRVSESPPAAPTLQEMSDDALVVRFEEAAMREYATRLLDDDEEDQQRNTDLRNAILGDVWDAMREVKARGLLERLLPLLANANVTVRREAAVACLRIEEERAIAVLEAIAGHEGWDDKFAARGAIDDWRAKGMVVYGV